MKKTFFMLLFSSSVAMAQNTASKADDMGRIVLNTYISESVASGLPGAARSLLENKLSQIATSNGLGGSSANPKFVITAKISVLDKEITATAPSMTALSLEIVLFIADFQTKTKYSTVSVSAKGVGQNETRAYMQAIKQLNPNAPTVRQFVDVGKTKIMEYYNTQCDFIIKDAQALVSQNKYDEAILKLASVPDVCKDCYDKAMDAVGPVYKKYIDRNCLVKLSDARAAFAASPNFEGAEKARISLAQIDPDAVCWSDAKAFTDSVRTKIMARENKNWDFMMRQYDVSTELSKQKVQSIKEAAAIIGDLQSKKVQISNTTSDSNSNNGGSTSDTKDWP